jgi:four helix bundle protein
MRDYHNYDVWTRAYGLTLAVRRAARKYPGAINVSLRSQTVRAADSVLFNIVEGCGAPGDREFARFLTISINSANELECQLLLARDERLISRTEWERLTQETIEVRRMICGLRRKLLNDEGEQGQQRKH